MRREYHRWHSPSLHRDMELLVFGHGGARLLAFPTSKGRFFEWENHGMVGCLREHLDRGWLQLFCVDSVDAESWYARGAHPADRVRRHEQYDRYILTEVLPFTRQVNADPFLITAGASFGAYHAMTFALRHPGQVGRVLALSGLFDVRRFLDGHYDQAVYFHSPCDFIPNEHDPVRLAALRQIDIIIAVGRDDPNYADNVCLSDRLWQMGIWHALRTWDGWGHDWPYWHKMLPLYVGGHD
jgi:esterase/lipase superfamily enzyme